MRRNDELEDSEKEDLKHPEIHQKKKKKKNWQMRKVNESLVLGFSEGKTLEDTSHSVGLGGQISFSILLGFIHIADGLRCT